MLLSNVENLSKFIAVYIARSGLEIPTVASGCYAVIQIFFSRDKCSDKIALIQPWKNGVDKVHL